MDLHGLNEKVEALFHEHTLPWRRYLHAHPYLSTEELPTAEYIDAELHAVVERFAKTHPDIDIDHVVQFHRFLPNSVVVDLTSGEGGGRKIGLRADIDALPITEASGESCSSTRCGVMHACGHDCHMAMLMSAIALLLDSLPQWRGTVRCIFQPAEEVCTSSGGGAPLLVEAGVLDGVEMIFGLHVNPVENTPTGTVGSRLGTVLHSGEGFKITLSGRGGHGAQPHLTSDLIAISGQIITGVQTMLTRCFPASLTPLLTICGIQTNSQLANVMPSQLEIVGTLRTIDDSVRLQAKAQLPNLVEHITRSFDSEASQAEAIVTFTSGVGCTVNHPEAFKVSASAIKRVLGGEDKFVVLEKPLTPSEDFSVYASLIPGCFNLLGCFNAEKGCDGALHTPQVRIDEDSMKVGIKVHYGIVMEVLGV